MSRAFSPQGRRRGDEKKADDENDGMLQGAYLS
jgi:hypothetical protein